MGIDIYSFLNSSDVEDYLRQKKYEFNALQAAAVIYRSWKKSFAEKNEAYKAIINNMADMPISGDFFLEQYPSIHDYLRRYIDIQNKLVDMFYRKSEGIVYRSKTMAKAILPGDECEYRPDRGIFYDPDECLKYLIKDKKRTGYYNDGGYIVRYLIEQVRIGIPDDSTNNLSLTFDSLGTIMGIDRAPKLPEEDEISRFTLGYAKLDLPMPFKRGDILIKSDMRNTQHPIALSWCPGLEKGWDDEKFLIFHPETCKIEDYMRCTVLKMDPQGRLYMDGDDPYIDYEYYRDELQGNNELLARDAVRDYFDGKINFMKLVSADMEVIYLVKAMDDSECCDTIGYFDRKSDAISCVRYNAGDMNEAGAYDFGAVVPIMLKRLYPIASTDDVLLFKYERDKDEYVEFNDGSELYNKLINRAAGCAF